MPDWLTIVSIIVAWDIVKIFIQAKVNQRVLKKDFDEIDEALDDVEEAIEEDTNGTGGSTEENFTSK